MDNSFAKHHKAGTKALREFRYDDAVASFIEAIKANPHDVSGVINLGIALTRQQNFGDAIIMLEQAIRQAPALATAHSSLGDAYHLAGEDEAAIRAYEKACDLATFDPDMWRKLGNLHLEMEDAEQAEIAFRAGLSADPDHAGTIYGLGQALALQGKLTEAEASFRRLETMRQPSGFDDSIRLPFLGKMIRLNPGFFEELTREKIAAPEMIGHFIPDGNGPVIFAAADRRYFDLHAEALVRSLALKHKGPLTLHLHICNPGEDIDAKVDALRSLAGPHSLNLTTEIMDVAALAPANDGYRHYPKTYYSCIRFLQLPRLMAAYRRPILVIDIDLVAAQDFSGWFDGLKEFDLGFNCKTRKDFANTFLATMVYAGSTGHSARYFQLVARYLSHFLFGERVFSWLIDQIALHATWCRFEGSDDEPSLTFFEDEVMNWMDVPSDSEGAGDNYLFLSHYSSVPRT